MHTNQYIEVKDGKYYITICEGCKTYEDMIACLSDKDMRSSIYMCDVSVPYKPDTGEICPCSTCLVKMVCKLKCQLLDDFLENSVIKVGDKKS